MEGLGCFLSELDCSWDSGCVQLCSSLGSPSVAHAHPLHKVYFFKDFLLVKGRNPVWHIFLAPSLSWFSVRAFVKSLCGVPCGGEYSASWVGGADPHQDRGKCPCLQPPPQDVRACAPWLVLTAIVRYYAQLWLAQVPFCFSCSWTSNLLPFP